MNELDYQDYQMEELYGWGESEPSSNSNWLKYTIFVFVITAPILIALFAARNRFLVAFFAYINCVVYGAFFLHFIRKGSLAALIPLLAVFQLILGTCLGIIYFSVFYPNLTYTTMVANVSYFEGGIKYQLVILSYLLAYFATIAFLLGKEQVEPYRYITNNTKRMAYFALALFLFVTFFSALLRVGLVPEFMQGWAGRLHRYYSGLLFIVGVAIARISKLSKVVLVLGIMAFTVFFTLGASRGWVVAPITALVLGIFFFSELKQKKKVVIMVSCIVLLPIYMKVGNTTRALLGAGGYKDIGYRYQVLKQQWRIAGGGRPTGVAFFGRMFFVAPNLVVAVTPSEEPYLGFELVQYAKETALILIPGPLLKKLVRLGMLRFRYLTVMELHRYGFNIIPGTSTVEDSVIGHLWMLGGWLPVIAGGIMVGLMHGLAGRIIRRASIQNTDKGIIYFAVWLPGFYGSSGVGVLVGWRDVIWHFIFAFVLWKIIGPFLKTANVESQYEQQEQYAEPMLVED